MCGSAAPVGLLPRDIDEHFYTILILTIDNGMLLLRKSLVCGLTEFREAKNFLMY